MTDFSQLAKKTVKTARYIFYTLEGRPSVDVKRADNSNKPYMNALLKAMMRGKRRRNVSVELIERNRQDDKKLYSKYVVEAWHDVVDVTGKPVKLTPESCEQFLNALPEWELDGLRDFAADPESFLDEGTDHEEAAKN